MTKMLRQADSDGFGTKAEHIITYEKDDVDNDEDDLGKTCSATQRHRCTALVYSG